MSVDPESGIIAADANAPTSPPKQVGQQPPGPPRTSQRYEALDGVRGLAALWIMLFHSVFYSDANVDGHASLNGSMLMTLFFVLSGFSLAITEGRTLWGPTPCCTGDAPPAPSPSRDVPPRLAHTRSPCPSAIAPDRTGCRPASCSALLRAPSRRRAPQAPRRSGCGRATRHLNACQVFNEYILSRIGRP